MTITLGNYRLLERDKLRTFHPALKIISAIKSYIRAESPNRESKLALYTGPATETAKTCTREHTRGKHSFASKDKG